MPGKRASADMVNPGNWLRWQPLRDLQKQAKRDTEFVKGAMP
jgi:hypothetical protein